MLVRKTCILFLFAALLGAGSLRAQQLSVEARIAGLESNEEDMSLLREDAQLQMREDSIVNAVERARRQLRENPAARQQYSQDILQLESRIFEIRNAKGRLIDRINTIEQEWVLANLGLSRKIRRRRFPIRSRCAIWSAIPISGNSSRRPTMPRSSKRSGWNSMPWIT